MTISTEVAAVLADARVKVKTCRADSADFALYEVEELCDALESAITKAEAVAWEERMRPVWDERSPWTAWERCSRESFESFASKPQPWISNDWETQRRALYAYTPPAVPVESQQADAKDAARFRWLRDHAINTEGRKGSPWCVYGLDLGDCTPTFGAELVAFVDDAMANGIVCSTVPVESLGRDAEPDTLSRLQDACFEAIATEHRAGEFSREDVIRILRAAAALSALPEPPASVPDGWFLGWARAAEIEKTQRHRSKRDGSALAVFVHAEKNETYSVPVYAPPTNQEGAAP